MQANFGERVGEIARADSVAAFTASRMRLGEMAITKIRLAEPTGEITEPLGGNDDAHVVSVSLQPGFSRNSWVNGRPLPDAGPLAAGTTNFMDMRDGNATLFRSPVRLVQFYFSRRALNIAADEQGVARVGELQAEPLVPIYDATFHHLAMIVRPAFARLSEVSPLFVDCLLMAGATHLLEAYGGVRGEREQRGGLAPWQLNRAMEMLEADLDAAVSLTAIATACRLSPRHFSRAFVQSTGVPPHRWQLHRRVERAKDLLRDSSLTLQDVAKALRFANQAHFSRVFSSFVGHSPSVWRRAL